MRYLVLTFAFALSGAFADSLNLTYSVSGSGGISAPQAPLGSNSFTWIDNTGGVSGSLFGQDGFNPLTAYVPTDWVGSTLLSNPFSLGGQDTLSVTATMFSQQWFSAGLGNLDTNGFALLLEGSTVKAILFDSRPDGGHDMLNIAGPPGYSFQLPTSNVAYDLNHKVGDPLHYDSVDVTLGGTNYYPLIPPPLNQLSTYCGYGPPQSDGGEVCSSITTSSFTPGAGTYQLLFGMFSLTGQALEANGGGPQTPAALAVDTVTITRVPESASWLSAMLLITAIFGAAARNRHCTDGTR